MSAHRIIVTTRSEAPEPVLRFWRARAAKQDPALALTRSPEWFDMMTEGQPENAFVGAVTDAAGECVAVVPLIRTRWGIGFSIAGLRIGGRLFPVLQVWGGELLAADLPAEVYADLLRSLLEQAPEVEAIMFEHVEVGQRFNALVTAARKAALLACCLSRDRPHYRLALPGTLEQFRAMRSKKSLSKIKGRERALQREAGAECRLVELRTREEWEPYGEAIERLMAGVWQTQVLDHGFHADSMDRVSRHDWHRSFLLCAGDRAIAFAFCYQGEGTLTYEQIGYERRFAKYSPGITLLYRLIERLYERDTPRFIDFGEGEGDYKRQLSNDVIRVASVLVARKRISTRMSFAAYTACGALDRALRSIASRTSLARRARQRSRRRGD